MTRKPTNSMYLAMGLEVFVAVKCGGMAGAAVLDCLSDEEEEQPVRVSTTPREEPTEPHRIHDAILNSMVRMVVPCALLLLGAVLLVADSGAGLNWTAPAGWKAEAERPMRLATYTVAPGAECGIYFFGAGQGGSVDANLDRWIGQFLQADGKPSKAAAKIAKRTIHGWPVTTVDVSGAYTGMGGPTAKTGARSAGLSDAGAIVEGPQGSMFLQVYRSGQDHRRESGRPSTRCLHRSNKMHRSAW